MDCQMDCLRQFSCLYQLAANGSKISSVIHRTFLIMITFSAQDRVLGEIANSSLVIGNGMRHLTEQAGVGGAVIYSRVIYHTFQCVSWHVAWNSINRLSKPVYGLYTSSCHRSIIGTCSPRDRTRETFPRRRFHIAVESIQGAIFMMPERQIFLNWK